MRYEELTIEGRNAVLEAFRSGKTIDKLFVQDGCKDGPVQTIVREARKGDTIINFVPRERLDQMSETGKKAYMGFQFQRCCGEGMALIDRKSNAVIENLTDYKVVGLENLGLKDEGDPYAYKIQKLGQKYLLLQMEPLSRPEGYEVLSVREVTGLFAELRQTAGWFTGIYLAVFLIAGLFT